MLSTRNEKSVGLLYLLPVPLFRRLALPILSKRATQKPTPICTYIIARAPIYDGTLLAVNI